MALVIALVLGALAILIPTAQKLASSHSGPTPVSTPTPTGPTAAVVLQAELDRDLAGVMTLVNDHTFGTAFLIDQQGDFLTAASLISGSASLRLIDNTGGSHAVRVIGIDASLGLAQVRAT